MTYGRLFMILNPNVKVVENGTCVWIYFDSVNHDTFRAEWWNKEIPDEVLKAQEPRVMTLEEVKRSTGEIVWAERWGTSETIVAQFAPYDTIDDSFYFFTIGNSVSYKAYSEDYYKDWRCWASRPTDEQREAVKWVD